MAWDPALLRKYNTTNHFRLLNQIRSELRDQPIQRPLVTTRTAASGGGGSRRSSTNTASTAPAPTRRRSSGASAIVPAPSQPPAELHQPIVAVPVITDLVLPDSHTGA